MDAKTFRRLFLGFFEDQGHAIIGGSSLIPEHDPSVLFTTAGMHPLVPFLLGEPHPAGKRLAKKQWTWAFLSVSQGLKKWVVNPCQVKL